MMLAQRTDLSFDRDASVRLIPFIVALMVYLAILALAGSLVLQRGMRHWGEGLTGTLTVQIPQPDQPNAALQTTRVDKVIQVLKALPDVEQARVIPENEIAALLQPWLGSGGLVRDLPLPRWALVERQNHRAYDNSDIVQLAGKYIAGIVQNHLFVDGNKRTAAVIAETFLMLNGYRLTASDAELVVAIVALAAGELDETELADWFREYLELR